MAKSKSKKEKRCLARRRLIRRRLAEKRLQAEKRRLAKRRQKRERWRTEHPPRSKRRDHARYMLITFFHQGEGLRCKILLTYNDHDGAQSIINKPPEKVWIQHGRFYPGKLTKDLVDILFKKFRDDTIKMDPKAKIKEGKGSPRFK